jgi:hypothetical protein
MSTEYSRFGMVWLPFLDQVQDRPGRPSTTVQHGADALLDQCGILTEVALGRQAIEAL